MCIRDSVRTYVRSYVRTSVRKHVRTYERTNDRPNYQTNDRTNFCTYLRTYVRTYVRTYGRTYPQKYDQPLFESSSKTSRDSCRFHNETQKSRDVCPETSKSGWSLFCRKVVGIVFGRKKVRTRFWSGFGGDRLFWTPPADS